MTDNNEKSEKKEQAVYKFGQKELDLNKYIHNLGTNLQTYMDKQTHWSEGQKQEFVNAYNTYIQGLVDQRDNNTNRFYTDDAGQIYDTSGVLSNRDNDGIDDSGSEYYYDENGKQITSSDYNQLRRRKQKNYNTFSANREVANYFNQIGRALSPAEKKAKEKFDVLKHGFVSHWNQANNKAGEKMDLKPFLDMDAYDANTGKRARTNRMQYLHDQLYDYMNGLEDNYDWEGTSYKSMDDYKASLQNLLNHMSDGTWDNNDEIAANQAGIGGSFYNAFFTEDEHPNLSDEERDKLKAEREDKAKKEAQEKWINEQLAIYDNNQYQWNDNNRHDLGMINPEYWSEEGGWNGEAFRQSFNEKDPMWNQYYDKNTKQFDYQSYFNDYLANPFSKEGRRAIAGLIGSGRAKMLQGGDYQGMYHIAQTDRDKRTNSGLVYDPKTGQLFYTFIGNLPDQWNEMTRQYNINNGHAKRSDAYAFKEGGIISMQIGGGFDMNSWMEEDRQRGLSEKGAANTSNVSRHNGRTAEQQEAGDRKAGILGIGVNQDAQNPKNGFSGTDYLRLSTIAADIVSMGAAFVPGYGTAISAGAGVGSSLGTFFADAFEDGLDSGDFKSLGANLGMDLLGLIPGGGSASKGMKIAKNLGKYATGIIAAVGAMNTLSNGKEIIGSYNKLLSSPKDLTVDDWRNISAGLGLVTGGVAAGTRKYQQAKMKAANAKPNNVAVELVDKKTNTKKTVLFDGDDASAIRKANESGDVSKIQEITRKYEDYKDLDVSTETNFGWKGLRDDNKKWQNPLGSKTGKARVFDVSGGYDIVGRSTGKTYATRGKWEADVELDTNIGDRKLASSKSDEDIAFGDLRKVAEKTNKRQKFATDKVNRFNELDDKLRKEGLSNEPGSNGLSEHGEYYQIKGKNKKSSSNKRIDILRKYQEMYSKPDYKSPELQAFEAKYVKDGQVNFPIEGTNRAVTGAWADIVKKYGLRKEGGVIHQIKRFNVGGTASVTSLIGTASNNNTGNEEVKRSTGITDFFGKRSINPTLSYGLPRAIYADSVNRKLTDMQIAAEKPLMVDNPNLPTRKIEGDLNSEMQGIQNKANLNSMANRHQVASPEMQMAMQLDAAVKGEEFANQGKQLSNTALKQSTEQSFQEARQEALSRQENATKNRASAMQAEKNKNSYEMAYESKKKEIYDTVGSQLEYDAKVKQAENKAYDLQFATDDIDNALGYDLGTYAANSGVNLSDQELKVWTDVSSGARLRSSLSDEEEASFNRAAGIAEQLKSQMLRQHLGIGGSRWSAIRQLAPSQVATAGTPQFNITDPEGLATGTVSAKKGAKLEATNQKARQADADRFQKAIKDAHDRHQKMLDQLSDSIYGFINASLD